MAKKKSKINIVKHVEKLLARKLQIKAQLADIEGVMNSFVLQMENAPKHYRKSADLKISDDLYNGRVSKLERREAELRGELFEISALTRAIPIRRLKPKVNIQRVRDLVLDAGLVGIRADLEGTLRAEDCVTACEVCVTSCNSECIACTECVTSCSTECTTSCTSDCVSCPTECVTLCTVGCPTMETYSSATGSAFNLPTSIDQADHTIQANALIETVAKHYQAPDRIEIDWS